MNKLILTFIIVLSLGWDIYAQVPTRRIEVEETMMGLRFSDNGYSLSRRDVENLLKTNKEAYMQYRAVKGPKTIASILSFTGGFMFGYPFGTQLSGQEPNWTMAGIGAGIIAASIPFNIRYNKGVRAAVSLYNADFAEASKIQNEKEFILGAANDGIGVALTF